MGRSSRLARLPHLALKIQGFGLKNVEQSSRLGLRSLRASGFRLLFLCGFDFKGSPSTTSSGALFKFKDLICIQGIGLSGSTLSFSTLF